jgi:hypothetical protein
MSNGYFYPKIFSPVSVLDDKKSESRFNHSNSASQTFVKFAFQSIGIAPTVKSFFVGRCVLIAPESFNSLSSVSALSLLYLVKNADKISQVKPRASSF